jgi:hypothetical protein
MSMPFRKEEGFQGTGLGAKGSRNWKEEREEYYRVVINGNVWQRLSWDEWLGVTEDWPVLIVSREPGMTHEGSMFVFTYDCTCMVYVHMTVPAYLHVHMTAPACLHVHMTVPACLHVHMTVPA